jgi:branched-chain amino acid transport system ATP-binding protein
MLRIEGLVSGYGRIEVLHGVSLSVPAGRVVAILGANGAGKSSLCRAISGLLPCWSGSISLDGSRLDTASTAARVRAGIVQVPEGRQVFPRMTVKDNLRLGAFVHGEPDDEALDEVFTLFPILRERMGQEAGLMSGGEQQMLAIARGLLSKPRIMLLDEPSQGLAPKAVDQVGLAIGAIAARGVGILVVEQNLRLTQMIAEDALVLETGEIVAEGPASTVLSGQAVAASYLGVTGEQG